MAAKVDDLATQLGRSTIATNGVSFEGKSLKFNNAEDASELVEAIKQCKDLHYLNLAGNTLGVEAAKEVGKALESHKEFKRALWKDLFTGRLKTEIPQALQYLGAGLVLAEARLTELDMSDNAFGPIGVEGLAVLLRSSACYNLQELRLNNNGLGIGGGKLLAKALLGCHKDSSAKGQPLALKVFIAGRNRLENDGAKALAQVFQTLGSLQEVAMPQNGIYHVGISAILNALTYSPQLRELNLNDNTVTWKGCEAIAAALPKLQLLRVINLGDCLLKSKGAIILSKALTGSHQHLEELILSFNEIGERAVSSLVDAVKGKQNIKQLILDGNMFGENGRQALQSQLETFGQGKILGSLEEDEDDGESEEDKSSEEEENSGSETEESAPSTPAKPLLSTPKTATPISKPLFGTTPTMFGTPTTAISFGASKITFGSPSSTIFGTPKTAATTTMFGTPATTPKTSSTFGSPMFGNISISTPDKTPGGLKVSALTPPVITIPESPELKPGQIIPLSEFLKEPSPNRLMALGTDRYHKIMEEFQNLPPEDILSGGVRLLMSVSTAAATNREDVRAAGCEAGVALYAKLFKWAEATDKLSMLNNALLINLQLIKTEEKNHYADVPWDLEGCMIVLEQVCQQKMLPYSTKDTLQLFLGRPKIRAEAYPDTKRKLMAALFKY